MSDTLSTTTLRNLRQVLLPRTSYLLPAPEGGSVDEELQQILGRPSPPLCHTWGDAILELQLKHLKRPQNAKIAFQIK